MFRSGPLDAALQQWTAADWRSLLPPRLRELSLSIPHSHTLTVRQRIIDALPVMRNLNRLSLGPADGIRVDPPLSAPLSLEPLLQLPKLARLSWYIGDLTFQQLDVIKQIETLRSVSNQHGRWSTEQLAFLSQRPHRLDQLEEVDLCETGIRSAHMAALAQLPGITSILNRAQTMPLDAFASLPRLSRLQYFALHLPQLANSSDADWEILDSSLRACPALTEISIDDDECSEATGERLLRALPHLRHLSFSEVTLPSLRFLRHAPPSLTELMFFGCSDLRVGHILALGTLLPQLESLVLRDHGDYGMLDELEQQALTPPGAVGLPNLRSFDYGIDTDC